MNRSKHQIIRGKFFQEQDFIHIRVARLESNTADNNSSMQPEATATVPRLRLKTVLP